MARPLVLPIVVNGEISSKTRTALARLLEPWHSQGMTDGFDLKAQTVLITGSSRGLGSEFARQYAMNGWNVIATCRQPEAAIHLAALAADRPHVVVEQLDVLDFESIEALADKYRGTPIDPLLNNAGISGGYEGQSVGAIDYEIFDAVMATNVLGPLKMAEAFVEHVAVSGEKKIISISSMPSSITLATPGRLYFDHSSKTALNMVMRTLSKDLANRGIIVGLVAPGLVDTDLTKALDITKISPEESVASLIAVFETYTPKMSGTLIQHTGEALPW